MLEVFVAYWSLLFVLCASIMSWWLDSRCKVVFSLIILLLINELLRVYPAFFYAYLNGQSSIYPLFVFLVAFSSIVGAYLITNQKIRAYGTSLEQYLSAPVYSISRKSLFVSAWCAALALILPSIYLYEGMPPVLSGLVNSVLGLDADLAAIGDARKQVTKGHIFGGEYKGQGIIRTLNTNLWPLLLGIFMTGYWLYRSIWWLLSSIAIFVFTFAFVSADGTRGSLMGVLIYVFSLCSFLYVFRLRHVLVAFLIIVLFAVGLSALSPKLGKHIGSTSFLEIAVEKITTRILLDNAMNDVRAISLVEEGEMYLRQGQLHYRDVLAAMPGTAGGAPFAYELFKYFNPNVKATTYSTGTYLIKPYMDYGLFGVTLVFLTLGVFLSVFQKLLLSFPKTVFSIPLVIYCIYLSSRMVLSGPVAFAVNLVLILTFSLCIFMFFRALTYLTRGLKKSSLEVYRA